MAFRGTHHCQLIPHDERDTHAGINSSAWRNCQVNPGHEKFIPVREFTMGHLPPECQTERWMKWIKRVINLTVKISVHYTSKKRPNTFPGCDVKYSFADFKGMNMPRCGTGWIYPYDYTFYKVEKVEGPCPCPECKNEPKMEYWKFRVNTASHVLYDKSEAETSEFELFYDSEDKEGVKKLYGIDVLDDERKRYETDKCRVECVTHDPGLAATLNEIISTHPPYPYPDHSTLGFLVSHPHGASKMISFGRFHYTSHVSRKPGQSFEIGEGCRYHIPASNGQQTGKLRDSHGVVKNVTEPVNASIEHNKKCSQNSCHDNPQPSDSAESISLELCDSRLPFAMTAIPPPTASFQWQGECGSDYYPDWVTFPTGTRFVTDDGDNVNVTPNTQFDWDGLVDGYGSWMSTYDMASCPGSSGAGVDRVGDGLTLWCHFGKSGEEDGCNVSGLDVDNDDDDDDDDDDVDDDNDDDDDDDE